MPLQPTWSILNGRYRILRQLGEGGFARVWLAEDTTRRLEVAIKEPRPGLTGSQAAELADRFARELRYSGALFQVEAPNTVRVITVEECDGAPLLVMEYCGGGSLRERLLRDGPLPVGEAVRLALDLLAALHVVHETLGWVHRDLKPANVLFTADGRTRLADFGLAQTGDSGRSSGGQSHPGSVGYMSPEQETTIGYLTPASDLYALGCVLFESLTGKLYKRVRPGTRAGSLRPDVPTWLDDVLARALDADPWSRYESADEMAAALRHGVKEERQRIEADQRMAAEAAEQARLQQEVQRKAEEEAERVGQVAAAQEAARQAEVERQRMPSAADKRMAVEARAQRAAAAPRLANSTGAAPAPARKLPVGWIVAAVGLVAVIVTWAATRPPGPAQVAPTPTAPPMLIATPHPEPTKPTAAPTAAPPTTAPEPTKTPTATAVPTAVPTPTPVPQLAVNEATINVRSGPGTVYPIVGTLRQDETREITGKNAAGDWWQIVYDGKPAWLSAAVVRAGAASGAVTVVAAPPTPVATATPTLGIGPTWISPIDSMTLVYVAAGEFPMGSAGIDGDAQGDERPQHRVTLDAFWIDRTEVTNAQYRRCVAAGACQPPIQSSSSTRTGYYGAAEFDNYPVIYVSWDAARNYCAWAGRRLPTEAEWEKAARGTDGRKYPWGDTAPDAQRANFNMNKGDTTAVGSYPTGASPYGAWDMAGNVWEWVGDWYNATYYGSGSVQNPKGPDSGQYRVLRGGWWLDDAGVVRAANRNWDAPGDVFGAVGFRCARS